MMTEIKFKYNSWIEFVLLKNCKNGLSGTIDYQSTYYTKLFRYKSINENSPIGAWSLIFEKNTC